MEKRTLDQLINSEDPGWTLVEEWIEQAQNQVDVLLASEPSRNAALLATQVTTRSPMGAVIYETGGILIDHGWLRILGSGHPRLNRSLPEWNRQVGNDLESAPLPFLLIADDVVGGFYALDGGVLGKAGNVFYYAPDSLEWEDTECGYSQFLQWSLSGDLEQYYLNARWPEWQDEVAQLKGDQGLSIYPFLCAEGPLTAERSRKAVPILELYGLYVEELPKQLLADTQD